MDQGADINAKNGRDQTALMHACVNDPRWFGSNRDHFEIAKLLLENGADANAVEMSGRTALTRAAESCNEQIVKLLLEQGADVNSKELTGMTALIWASCRGCYRVVRELLANGADVRVRNKEGHTALIAAVGRHCRDMKPGATMSLIDPLDGWLSRLSKEENSPEEVLKLLLRYGADINAWDNGGRTALIWARWTMLSIVKLLVEHGADVNGE